MMNVGDRFTTIEYEKFKRVVDYMEKRTLSVKKN